MRKELFIFILLGSILIAPVMALSANITENGTTYFVGNVLNNGNPYKVFVNEKFWFNTTEEEIIIGDLQPNTKYFLRVEDEASNTTISTFATTSEIMYGGFSISAAVLLLIWLVAFILGVLYIPLLVGMDIIPLIVLLTNDDYLVVSPKIKVFLAMLIPVTLITFKWALDRDKE